MLVPWSDLDRLFWDFRSPSNLLRRLDDRPAWSWLARPVADSHPRFELEDSTYRVSITLPRARRPADAARVNGVRTPTQVASRLGRSPSDNVHVRREG